MTDLVACPTCQTTLRLPSNAATVRCPKCKTLLDVLTEPPGGSPSPTPPPPPKPLPFEAAPAAAAKPTIARAVPPAPVSKDRHRPELVDEEHEAELERMKQARAEAERKRQVRKELAEMDRSEEEEEDRYAEIDEHCRWGRISLQTLRWSLLGYIFSLTVGYLVLLPLVAIGWLFGERDLFGAFGTVLPGFSLLVNLGALLGTGVGFVFAVRGPREARHIAIMGLVAVAAQIVCVCGTVGRAVTEAARYADAPAETTGYPDMVIAYVLVGTASNLQTTSDAPVRVAFQFTSASGYEVPWVNVVCGVFEFTRLLLLCMLVQRYAELGKSDRVAGESPKTVNRVFFSLVVFALFRGAACIGFDWFQDGTMWYIGQVIHVLIFEGLFLVIGVRLLTQFGVINDTADVLIADRVASKYDTFNEV